MGIIRKCFFWPGLVLLLILSVCQYQSNQVTVPFILDHNRMLVDAEIQKPDGTWRSIKLWVDSGNPEFFLHENLAKDLGYDLSKKQIVENGQIQPLEVQPFSGLRIGGKIINCDSITTRVMFQPEWLFTTMHNDANLPATVLRNYHIVFDYPKNKLTIADPGTIKAQGEKGVASIHPETGIVQMDAVIAGDSLSFALDNGASYSFASEEFVTKLSDKNSDWPLHKGALGCANIWGWWPEETSWPVLRTPEIMWGDILFADAGIAGVPNFFGGMDVGQWYSLKTAKPVHGFLGPNVFKNYRVEIDYLNSCVYFQKGKSNKTPEMDIVGLTLRPEPGGSYRVIGVALKDGKSSVPGVLVDDILLQINDLNIAGATMGTVVDALRGKPGETHSILLNRNGEEISVEAKVERFLLGSFFHP